MLGSPRGGVVPVGGHQGAEARVQVRLDGRLVEVLPHHHAVHDDRHGPGQVVHLQARGGRTRGWVRKDTAHAAGKRLTLLSRRRTAWPDRTASLHL